MQRKYNRYSLRINDVLYVEGIKHNLLSTIMVIKLPLDIPFALFMIKNDNKVLFIAHNKGKCLYCELQWHCQTKIKCMHLLKIQVGYSILDYDMLVLNLLENYHRMSMFMFCKLNLKKKNHLFYACQMGKQIQNSFKSENMSTTSRRL